MRGEPPTVEWTGTYYLTVLDRAADAACVDVHLRGGDDALAIHDVTGDTLYILDRRLTGLSVETWLFQTRIPHLAECPEENNVVGWMTPSSARTKQ